MARILFTCLSIALLCSCSSSSESGNVDPDPILGTWNWASGSRQISPSGFERLHRDHWENYLVNLDNDFKWTFESEGTFVTEHSGPTATPINFSGLYELEGDSLILEMTNGSYPVSRFKVPFIDDANLDLQWSVQYQEFTDAQIDTWLASGVIGPDGNWTVDRDSLYENHSTLITSAITIHYVKVD